MIENGAQHFEDFDGITYLNCAAMGPLPRVTVQAIQDVLPLKIRPNRIPDDILFRIPDGVRAAVAPLIRARPEEIFIGSGASHGMNVAGLGVPLAEGDEVVVAANDFPSNVYIWTEAARRSGARRVLVKGRRHAATTREILDAITSATRVVSVSYIDFGSGEIIDLEQLAGALAGRDVFLAVDATQAVGVVPVDVHALGVSLLTVGAYKWMLGPYGAGAAWLHPGWADRIDPAYITWTAAAGAENYNALPRENYRWVDTARRYDGPEAASFLNMAGVTRSAQFIAEIGLEAVHRHVTGLLEMLERELPAPFRRRSSPSRIAGPILCIEADDVPRVHRIYRELREAGFWVGLRDDGIRISPHIYNTGADIARLIQFLGTH